LIPLELFFFNILYHFFLLFPQFMPLLSISTAIMEVWSYNQTFFLA